MGFNWLSEYIPSAVTLCGQACLKYIYKTGPKFVKCSAPQQKNKNYFIAKFTTGFNDSN